MYVCGETRQRSDQCSGLVNLVASTFRTGNLERPQTGQSSGATTVFAVDTPETLLADDARISSDDKPETDIHADLPANSCRASVISRDAGFLDTSAYTSPSFFRGINFTGCRKRNCNVRCTRAVSVYAVKLIERNK